MKSIFTLVVGSVLLLHTVIVNAEEVQAENALPHGEPEEDRDMIHHGLPDDLVHQLQPEVLVLHETPMNEPEEDWDMIHHDISDISQEELWENSEQLHETSMNEATEDVSIGRNVFGHPFHTKMVLPYEAMNEPEEDRDMIHHDLPDNLAHKHQTDVFVLPEEPMNEPEEDRDDIHHGI